MLVSLSEESEFSAFFLGKIEKASPVLGKCAFGSGRKDLRRHLFGRGCLKDCRRLVDGFFLDSWNCYLEGADEDCVAVLV